MSARRTNLNDYWDAEAMRRPQAVLSKEQCDEAERRAIALFEKVRMQKVRAMQRREERVKQ